MASSRLLVLAIAQAALSSVGCAAAFPQMDATIPPTQEQCPPGTTRQAAAVPGRGRPAPGQTAQELSHLEVWCEAAGGIKEGPFAEYNWNGDVLFRRGTFRGGKMHGPWTVRELTGPMPDLWREGEYKDGLREGRWVVRSGGGLVFSEETYKDGKLSGPRIESVPGPQGLVTVETTQSDGAMTGPVTRRAADGRILETGSYIDGKKSGVWVRYYPNGAKADERTFENDQLAGPFTVWSADGRKKEEGSYRGGLLDGQRRRFYPSGALMEEVTYRFGSLSGPVVRYFEDGAKGEEGAFLDNKREGVWTRWDKNGAVVEQSEYKDGRKVTPPVAAAAPQQSEQAPAGGNAPEKSASAPAPTGNENGEIPLLPPASGKTAEVPPEQAPGDKPEQAAETGQKTEQKPESAAASEEPARKEEAAAPAVPKRGAEANRPGEERWFRVQTSVGALFLFGEGPAEIGVGGYFGVSLGKPRVSGGYDRQYSGVVYSFGLDMSYLWSISRETCTESGCEGRFTIGPAARLGYAKGVEYGGRPFPLTYFYLQGTPFVGVWERSEGVGARLSAGITAPAWTARCMKFLGNIMAERDTAPLILLIGPVVLPISILNHVELVGEVAYDGDQARWRGGAVVGGGF